jgi:hypothetical protein
MRSEDCILLGIRDAARSVSVRYTRKGWVHLPRRQGGIVNRAEAAGLVDVDLPTALRRGSAEQ